MPAVERPERVILQGGLKLYLSGKRDEEPGLNDDKGDRKIERHSRDAANGNDMIDSVSFLGSAGLFEYLCTGVKSTVGSSDTYEIIPCSSIALTVATTRSHLVPHPVFTSADERCALIIRSFLIAADHKTLRESKIVPGPSSQMSCSSEIWRLTP
jgi:hypothetical protein